MQGVARSFQGEGGGGDGFTLCQSTYQIVKSFLPSVVGCLLKRLRKGGSRGPQDPPSYVPALQLIFLYKLDKLQSRERSCLIERWISQEI